MTTHDNLTKKTSQPGALAGSLLIAALLIGTVLLAGGVLALQTGAPTSLLQSISSLLALDNVHLWWYMSRAAGMMGYLLTWLSTLWGFAVGSKIFASVLERVFTFDFHEHLSWLGLGFIGFHAIALLFDHVQPLNLAQILLPFASSYRPFWTGIGILGFYLTLLVTVTFYLRSKISMNTFRSIHYLSIAAYIGALFHGLYAGTDSVLTWMQWMYWGTFLSTAFFLVYWLGILWARKQKNAQRAQQLSPKSYRP